MTAHGPRIARLFREVADLLEVQGANTFRVRAYREAAETLETLDRDVGEMVEQDEDLSDLPTIGEDLAAKIEEIVTTGRLEALEDLRRDVPTGLREVAALPGLGPKRTRQLHQDLGIEGLEDLRSALEDQEVRDLDGFGPRLEERILEALQRDEGRETRFRRDQVAPHVDELLEVLGAVEGVDVVEVAGSWRRGRPTVGDLDVLVACRDPAAVVDAFVALDHVDRIEQRGRTKARVVLEGGLPVDLRVVPRQSFGAALHYFTGSKAHNIALRGRAGDRGLTLNEYGLFPKDADDLGPDGDPLAGRDEDDLFDRLDLSPIPPVLREGRGEIAAAERDDLPKLLSLDQLRGDLHAHTDASDGRASLEEMARAAQDLGHAYLAITDHSQRVAIADGLTPERYREQHEAIDAVQSDLDDLTLLKGCEVDILPDGTLDLPEDLLDEMDIVVAAVHEGLHLPEEAQTERIVSALRSGHVNILAHPTTRLLRERDPIALDLDQVLAAAADEDVALELNSNPRRLDLDGHTARRALEAGCRLAISSDAHRTAGLKDLRHGVQQAGRAWAEADDVINTRGLKALRDLLTRG